MELIMKFKGWITTFSAILATLVYFFGFIKLDTEPFKSTEIAVVSTAGFLFIEWDLADTPDVPTQIIYYVDGIQFANESYPEGLGAAIGLNTTYVSSYVLPPVAQINPGEHDFAAIVSFNGWSTLFSPENVKFKTRFTPEGKSNENSNNSSYDDRAIVNERGTLVSSTTKVSS